MHCLKEETLLALIEGRLPAADKSAADLHLAGCEHCFKLLALSANISGSKGPAAADGAVPPSAGTRAGRFEIEGPIGAGGMGIVYAARDPELGRRVALKLLRPEAFADDSGRERALAEARAMARLSHRNVVAIYDVGSIGNEIFIAMELVEGRTLRQWLTTAQRGWREILAMFVEAGRGLAAAHAAGLVHRDFKPDNVLVGNDGRVMITDFGLARLGPEAVDSSAPVQEIAASESSPAPRISPNAMTPTGAILGTPAYMALEQMDGAPASPASDLFGFCTALFEALYGLRPFAGKTVLELRNAIRAGDVREAPREKRVPGWLHRLVLSGLAADPAARPASMNLMLGQLERGPARIALRRRLAVGAALACVLALLAVRATLRARAQLCTGAATELAKVWSGDRRGKLLSSAPKGTAGSLADFASSLDAHFSAWARMRTEACEASRIRGEQSEQLLDLRMACLDRKLQDSDALLVAVEQGGAAAAKNAPRAISQLPPLSLCANTQALQSVGPLPADPVTRANVEALQKRASQLEAMRTLGVSTGVPEARKVLAEAQALHHRPLVAEVLLALGGLEDIAGDSPAAHSDVFEAATAALGARDDATAARAFTRLLRFENYARHFADAHQWAKLAAAALERLGGDDALELSRFTELARVVRNEGDLDEGLVLARQVLERTIRVEGPSSGLVAGAHHDLALALRNVGRLDEAADEERKALALLVPLYGEQHPRTLLVRAGLGETETSHGQLADGERDLRLSLASAEIVFGKDNPNVGDALINLSINLRAQKRVPEALELARRALEIYRQRLGEQHARIAFAELAIGQLLDDSGDAKGAVPSLERALAIASTSGDPAEAGEIKLSLALALQHAQLDPARAHALAQDARDYYAAVAKRYPQSSNQEALERAQAALAQGALAEKR